MNLAPRKPRLRLALASALSALALAGAAASSWAAQVPAGTLITGTASGAASSLLGADGGFTPGSNITALSDTDLEFLSDDYALGIDFFSSGLVRIYDNTGLGALAGSYTLTFDFAALPLDIDSFALADVTLVSGGTLSATRLNAHAVQLTMNNLVFNNAFDTFTAQIGTGSATVPEPASAALVLAALGLMAASRRRDARGVL